jgi:digeranylgeranylglycerophospholipid reductase
MSPTHDLVVIGAGIAGGALAESVAARGLDVVLVDRRVTEKLGGDWINVVDLSMLESLEGVLHPTEEELLRTEPEALFVPDLDGASTPFDAHGFVGLRVRPYVQRTVGRAVARGARLLPGRRVRGLLLEGGRVAGVETTEGPLRARVVADASGCAPAHANRWLAALGDPPLGLGDTVAAYQGTFGVRSPARVAAWGNGRLRPGVLVAFLSPYGAYSTLTLLSRPEAGEVFVLVGSKEGMGAVRRHVAEIVRDLELEPRPSHGGGTLVPIRRPLDRPVRPGLLILGDAAHLAAPIGGSGTVSALSSAALASRTLAAALASRGAPDLAALWPYAVALQRQHGAILASYDPMRRVIERLRPGETQTLLEGGLVTPDEILRCAHEQPLRPRVRALPSILAGALARPRLSALLAPAVASAFALEALYRAYPAGPEAAASRRWHRAARAIERTLEAALDLARR